jgi:hypothetical protein
MRLNRGTILLLLASLIVIVAVVLLNNQRTSAPDVTPTATESAGAGPVFPTIADVNNQGSIVKFEVTDTAANTKVVMTKDAANIWTITESASPSQLPTDQTKAVGTMSVLASMTALDSFTTDKLADFGLDQPKYTMALTDKDNKTYTLKIGNPTPANPRYYALVDDNTTTVYILSKDLIDGLIKQISEPPYVPSPTPTATFTATANPYSEVDQTATAVMDQQTATAMAEITVEATQEATAEAVSPTVAPTSAPTVKATEATPEATP